MTATVNSAVVTNPGSASTQTIGPLTVAGNFQLVIAFISGSTVHATAVTDTLGNTYSSVIGSIGNANSVVTSGAFHISAFYAPSTGTGSNTVTLTYSGVTGTPTFLYYADCSGIASAASIVSNIYNNQSALANGTNVISVSGGTGSDNISTAPALIVTAVRANGGTVTAGTGFTKAAGTGSAAILEYQYVAATGTVDSTASLASGSGSQTANTWQIALSAPITQADAKDVSITGNGPGTLTANSACAPKDLLIAQFSLSNVALENAGFVPTITDNVNTGNYTVQWTQYYATGSVLIGFAYIVANASGTPTVTLGGSTAYSNGNLTYVRWSGFSATPTLDGTVQTNTGNSTTPSGSIVTNGVNELVAALSWGLGAGGSYSTSPGGWNFVSNASGGTIFSPYWQENTAPGSSSFTGGILSSSQVWYTALAGFSSGAVAATGGLPYFPGPGVTPDKRLLFFQRVLNTVPPVAQNFVTGYSGAYGYANLLPVPTRGAVGYSGAYGYALLTLQSIYTGAPPLRGPGVSADWPQSFILRPLASSKNFTPAGVIQAVGYSGAYGYAFTPSLGLLTATGYSGAYGFANLTGVAAIKAYGYSGAYGFGDLLRYVFAATGYSGAYGYAKGTVSGVTVAVPNVISLSESLAILEITSLGLNVNVQAINSTITPPGFVSQQSPPGGTQVLVGSTVTIFVSIGQFVPAPNKNLGYRVTTRQFSLEEMVAREWGPSFRAPDHRIYVWSNDRAFDSTDIGTTGFYTKGVINS